MKIGFEKGFLKEMADTCFALHLEFMEKAPCPAADGMTEKEAEKAERDWEKRADAYVSARIPPVWQEFFRWFDGRSGDEGELLDRDGRRLTGPDGSPVQEWSIDARHRIVDGNGNQVHDSDGMPILAERMSETLIRFMRKKGLFEELEMEEPRTEEDMWF